MTFLSDIHVLVQTTSDGISNITTPKLPCVQYFHYPLGLHSGSRSHSALSAQITVNKTPTKEQRTAVCIQLRAVLCSGAVSPRVETLSLVTVSALEQRLIREAETVKA